MLYVLIYSIVNHALFYLLVVLFLVVLVSFFLQELQLKVLLAVLVHLVMEVHLPLVEVLQMEVVPFLASVEVHRLEVLLVMEVLQMVVVMEVHLESVAVLVLLLLVVVMDMPLVMGVLLALVVELEHLLVEVVLLVLVRLRLVMVLERLHHGFIYSYLLFQG